MKPGTIEHFMGWAADLVLDTGETWLVEKWQRSFIADVLAGKPAAWLIVPEGNGKTTMMAGLALYALDPDGWGQNSPMVVVAAATREQAEWLYLQAEGFVMATPGMKDRLRCLPGHRRITLAGKPWEREPGRIQIFAADDRTADGAIFTLAIIDELHNHRDLRLWRRWHGKLEKRGGQVVAISTAGEPGSEFEDARALILKEAPTTRKGAFIRAEDEGIVLHDWALRDRSKANDMRAVAAANPRKALTATVLRRKHADKTMTPEHWLRFTCNIATRIEGSGVLPEDWEGCFEPNLVADPHAKSYGGIDLGFSQDCTGLVVVNWESYERRVVVWSCVLEPPVDEADIVAALVEAQKAWNPVSWAFDPSRDGAQMAQLLDKGRHPDQGDVGFKFAEHAQSNQPMALAAVRLDAAIRNHWLRHDGDTELRKHVLNAIKKDLGAGRWRFDRPAQTAGARPGNAGGKRHPIDALIALAMAHSLAAAENEKTKEPMIAWK
jgi:phage terminase large subunit-like protein